MSNLPEGWKSVRLRDAGVWLSGGTPSTDEPRFWDGKIPWISAASLKDFYICDSDRRLTHSGVSGGSRLVPRGSVLFIVRGMSLKKEFRVGVTKREVAFGQDCKAIIPLPGIDGRFLAMALKVRENEILRMVDEAGHGTGRLPTELIASLEINIPSELREQQQIVEMVEAIDSLILSAKAGCSKLRTVREGTVAELMVRGPNGTASQWLRLTCRQAFRLASGIPYTGAIPAGQGSVPIYGASGISGRGGQRLTDGPTFAIGRVGEGGVGVVHYIPGAAWITDNALWATQIHSGWNSEFIAHYLSWFNLRRLRSQTGQPLITQSVIAQLPIPKPPVVEQLEIVSILRDFARARKAREAEIVRLGLLKHGLMKELLTGRLRVPEAKEVVGIPGTHLERALVSPA